jgi:hypothetical protein
VFPVRYGLNVYMPYYLGKFRYSDEQKYFTMCVNRSKILFSRMFASHLHVVLLSFLIVRPLILKSLPENIYLSPFELSPYLLNLFSRYTDYEQRIFCNVTPCSVVEVNLQCSRLSQTNDEKQLTLFPTLRFWKYCLLQSQY